MQQYHALLRRILTEGQPKEDRTGTGTISVFGHQERYNLAHGFPLVTTKRIHLKSVIHELLWILSGSTNVRDLQKHGVTIWDEWADKNGNLGPVYGETWRAWPHRPEAPDGDWSTIDQITRVIDALKNNPDSRRHIVTAWNPANVEECALPPCHCFFQFYVSGGPGWYGGVGATGPTSPRRLHLHMYQRSADCFLGVPFNIASYALLLMMVAQVTGYAPGEFVHTIGDAHLYRNHLDQTRQQLTRPPMVLPVMHIDPHVRDLFKFTYADFTLTGYDPHPAIKADVSK